MPQLWGQGAINRLTPAATAELLPGPGGVGNWELLLSLTHLLPPQGTRNWDGGAQTSNMHHPAQAPKHGGLQQVSIHMPQPWWGGADTPQDISPWPLVRIRHVPGIVHTSQGRSSPCQDQAQGQALYIPHPTRGRSRIGPLPGVVHIPPSLPPKPEHGSCCHYLFSPPTPFSGAQTPPNLPPQCPAVGGGRQGQEEGGRGITRRLWYNKLKTEQYSASHRIGGGQEEARGADICPFTPPTQICPMMGQARVSSHGWRSWRL